MVRKVLRSLTSPRWRLTLRVLGVLLVVLLGLRLGIFWGFVVPIGLLVVWGAYYDYSHKPRGGWRAAPMGSFAVANNADPTFLVNERGDAGVDQTGRTFAAPTRVPTPEEQAALPSQGWEGLLWVALEVVVLAGLFLLVAVTSHT